MLDPTMVAVLEQLKDIKPMDQMSLDELRAFVTPMPMERRRPVASVEDIVIPPAIPARVYRPTQTKIDALLIYFHGGGFVIGTVETHDHVAREFCEALGCTTISVDYRLAPEHRFPAAPDDCLAAVRWAGENAAALGVPSGRIILIGDSAGGNLATVTCARLRDEGGPAIAGQILAYPVTDYHSPPTHSYLANAEGYSLTRGAMIRFWRDYLVDEAESRHPHAAPMRAADLSNLPPALVLTAEYDPLRDEGEAYAARLEQAGVGVKLIRYDGLIHGFLRMTSVSPPAAGALTDIADWCQALPR